VRLVRRRHRAIQLGYPDPLTNNPSLKIGICAASIDAKRSCGVADPAPPLTI
jgi:hypothetical protein